MIDVPPQVVQFVIHKIPPDKVKTTRITGGLHCPYKGLLLAKPKGFRILFLLHLCPAADFDRRWGAVFSSLRDFPLLDSSLQVLMSIFTPLLNHFAFFTHLSSYFSPHRHSLFGTTGIARGFLFYNKKWDKPLRAYPTSTIFERKSFDKRSCCSTGIFQSHPSSVVILSTADREIKIRIPIDSPIIG